MVDAYNKFRLNVYLDFIKSQIQSPVLQARNTSLPAKVLDSAFLYGKSRFTGVDLKTLRLLINILKYCLLFIFTQSLWDSWVSIQKINEKTSIGSQIWIYTGGFIDLIFIGLWVYAFWLGKMQVIINGITSFII
jgi:hypothetical protein